MADLTYYLSLPYTKTLKRDDEGDILATIAELDGCLAYGTNDVEALENLLVTQKAWIEAALNAGQDIPMPSEEEDLPSGKFVVRLPRSLHRKLNKLADADDVSLNQVMVMAASEHVARRESRHEFKSTRHLPHGWGPTQQRWGDGRQLASHGGGFLKRVQERGSVSEADDPQWDRHFQARARRG